jgi:hypothetical protein
MMGQSGTGGTGQKGGSEPMKKVEPAGGGMTGSEDPTKSVMGESGKAEGHDTSPTKSST